MSYFGRTASWTVSSYVCALAGSVMEYSWLIVAIDSCRGVHLVSRREGLTHTLRRVGASPRWEEEGLWLDGESICRCAAGKILTPFSAVYVFPLGVLRSPMTQYANTSETDTFCEATRKVIESQLAATGAIGYLADGCGLNYWLVGANLGAPLANDFRFIR